MSFHTTPTRILAIGLLAVAAAAGCGGDDLLILHPCELQLADTCSTGDERPCYEGPSGTEDTGMCRAGTQACGKDRKGYGACLEQVLPAPDDCAAPTSFSCDTANHCGSLTLLANPFDDLVSAPASVDAEGNLAFAFVRSDGWHERKLFVEKRSPDGALLWSVNVTPEPLEDAWLNGVGNAPDGDVIVTGWALGDIDLGDGPTNVPDGSAFVARYAASDGALRWARTYPVDMTGFAVDTSGNITVSGVFRPGTAALGSLDLSVPSGQGGYVARLDGSGEPLWVQTFGDSPWIQRIAVDATGTTFAAGYGDIQSNDACDSTSTLRVSAFEADGTPRFTKTFGDHKSDLGGVGALAVDANGRVAVAAFLSTFVDARGPLDLGGATVEGTSFLAVLDPAQGDVVWARSLFGWSPGSLLFDAHGNVILAGARREHATIARYTHDGTLFSLVESEARSPYPDITMVRLGDSIHLAASVETGEGDDRRMVDAMMRADP